MQLALVFLSLPGRVLGSEIRPRKFKCVRRSAVHVLASDVLWCTRDGRVYRGCTAYHLALTPCAYLRSSDYVLACTDEAARRREALMGGKPRRLIVSHVLEPHPWVILLQYPA